MTLLLILTFLLSVLFWEKQIGGLPLTIRVIISASITMVLLSCSYFICIWAQIDFLWGLLIAFVLFLSYLIRIRKEFSFSIQFPNSHSILWVILISLAIIYYQKYVIPWGGWDAVAIWNLHAKFLADNNHWHDMFQHPLAWSHPDYPLFLPSLIAMGWKALNEINYIVPVVLGVIPLIGVISILFFAFNNKFIGVIAAFIILFDHHFIEQAASQYADTWLAFFILMAVYLISQLPQYPQLAWVLGLLVTTCGWIKNEGLLFFILVSGIALIALKNERKEYFRYLISCSPVLLVLVMFKITWSPTNDMVSESNTSIFSKLGSWDRYELILQYFKKTILNDFPFIPGLIILGIFLIKKMSPIILLIGILIVLMFGIYMGIYVITPKDLAWHLSTSFYRLMHQIYPSFLLCYFLAVEQNTKAFLSEN